MLRQEQVESWSIGKLCPNLAEGLPGGSVHMPANGNLPPDILPHVAIESRLAREGFEHQAYVIA